MDGDDFARFATPEIALDVPPGWEDCSVTRYVFPERRASIRLSMVPSPDHDVRYHAFALMERMQRNAPGYRVVSRKDVAIDGVPAFELVFDWEQPSGRYRNFVRLIVNDRVLWMLTGTTPHAALEETEEVIRRAMSTFALRT